MTATAIQETPVELEDAIQYLTFTLDGECFATDISQVREVLEFSHVTPVPRTPDFMRGSLVHDALCQLLRNGDIL